MKKTTAKKSNPAVPNRRAEVGKMSRAAKITVLIGALLGALLLWIYAIGYDSTLFESTFSGVNVTLTGETELAEKMGFTLAEGQRFSSITVVAKGKRSELNELTSADFNAVVDVSGATHAGEQTFKIAVYSPNGVEVVSQSSDTVVLFIDEFTQRSDVLSVAVDTGVSYVMAEGVTFVDASANPISVLVTGPRSKLDEVEGAYVRFPLDGVTIDGPIYGYGEIELRDRSGNVIDNPYISLSERTAYVSVTVTKQKTVPVRVAFTGGIFSPDEVSVDVSAENVTVSGSPDALTGIDELVLNVDETTVDGSGDFDFFIASLLPEGVTNESGASKISVHVVLPKMAVRTYALKSDSITVTDLPDGAEYAVIGSYEVTLMGARSAFDGFDPSGIAATVSFSRLKVNGDNTYSAKPAVTLGEGAEGIYVFDTDLYITFAVTMPVENTTDDI